MADATAYSYGPPAPSAGCLVVLIDECRAQEARVAEGTRSKAESLATAVNSLLAQLCQGPPLDVAIVGYRAEDAGPIDVGCRWAGPLTGRRLVAAAQLPSVPLAVENRVRRVPGPGGIGVREESVRFPIWYAPRLGHNAPAAAAFALCRDLLAEWQAGNPGRLPLVLHFPAELGRESLYAASAALRPHPTSPTPLLFHAHLSSSARLPSTLFPANGIHLSAAIRDAFEAASILPDPLAAALRQAQVAINPAARGLIAHARPVDLIRFMLLVRAYRDWMAQSLPQPTTYHQPSYYPTAQPAVASAPLAAAPVAAAPTAPAVPATPSPSAAPAPPTAAASVPPTVPAPPVPPAAALSAVAPAAGPSPLTPEQRAALVVLVLDRSAEAGPAAAAGNVWQRLQERANELLADLARRGKGALDVASVSYGGEAHGPVVYAGFTAVPNAAWLPDQQLAGAAIRVDQTIEQVSNGIGGLVSLPRKKPVFIDMGPAAAISPVPAFEAAAWVAGEWRARHPASRVPAVVLHMTRGCFVPADLQAAIARLYPGGGGAAVAPVVVYHLVLTERPYRSVAYPSSAAEVEFEQLPLLWQLSGPLLGARRLAARRPAVSPQSRGMVVNGTMDLLVDGIEESLAE